MNIIQLISNKTWGGGERYALDLSRALADAGHSVGVITRRCEAVDGSFTAAGLTPGHLPLGGMLDLFSPLQLARILNRIAGPVVVHCHNFKTARTAVWARRLAHKPGNVKIVVTRHLARPAGTGKADTDLYRALDAIIFVSETARKAFLSTNPAVDAARLYVVHNALAMPPLPTPKSDTGPVELLYMGRIDPEKGLDVLIEALGKLPAELPYWHITIAGTGRGRTVMPLLRRARDLNLESNITWAGFVADAAPLLAKAHIGALPTRVPEAFGLAILEYMHSGTVPVVTDSGAQTEIVTDGADGAVVATGNADALADALARLIADGDERRRLAAAAVETASKRFDYSNFLNDITKIYKEATAT